MKITLEEAKAECKRWFDYLERQEKKTLELQNLAAMARSGKYSRQEIERRRTEIDGAGFTVYDGAGLADAVRVLLSHTP